MISIGNLGAESVNGPSLKGQVEAFAVEARHLRIDNRRLAAEQTLDRRIDKMKKYGLGPKR